MYTDSTQDDVASLMKALASSAYLIQVLRNQLDEAYVEIEVLKAALREAHQ